MRPLHIATAAALLGALSFAAQNGPRATEARQAPAEAFSSAELRMQARWAGRPEPGGAEPALAGFPNRATWDACQAEPLAEGCDEVLRAMIAFPPIDAAQGHALVTALGAKRFLEGPPHRAPLVVSWGAGASLRSLDRDNLLVLAAATATLLGSEIVASDDDPRLPGPDDAVAGLERLRQALHMTCLDCAPPPAPLPAPRNPEVSASLAGERIVRSGTEAPDVAPPLGAVVAASRGTGAHPMATWVTPGLAGLAALEMARAGDSAAIPHLLAQGVRGPDAPDRVAALYAAAVLMQTPGEATGWATKPSCAGLAGCPEGAHRLARVLATLHGT